MSKYFKIGILTTFVSLSLFSCGQKGLTKVEAKKIINNIETSLKSDEFKFPTKLTIQKIDKIGENVSKKYMVRFSLEDKFYYVMNTNQSLVEESWNFVKLENQQEMLYTLKSVKSDNKFSTKTFSSKVYDDQAYFEKIFDTLKDEIVTENSTASDAINDFSSLIEDSDKIKEQDENSTFAISSFSETSLKIKANILTNKLTFIAEMEINSCLPVISKVKKIENSQEIQNYSTQYFYNVCNITKPNLEEFISNQQF